MILSFMGGQLWNWFEGPEEVIVQNVDQFNQKPNETVEPMTVQFDLGSQKELSLLREALLEVKKATDTQTKSQSYQSDQYIQELEARIAQLSADQQAAALLALQAWEADDETTTEETDGSVDNLDESITEGMSQWNRDRFKYRPKYELPTMVKGYRRYSPRFLKDPVCPNQQLLESSFPTISFQFADTSKESLISPLIADIARVKTSTEVYQVFSEQYKLQPGVNSIELDINLQKAEYILSFGYYIRRNVDEEYPKFYAFTCEFSVIDRSFQ
jgi:hypothetical protein